jgi:alkylated DNA repair dioxygenase AlkB
MARRPDVSTYEGEVGDKKWERANVNAEPRSAYLLSGSARSEWEHSIPSVDALFRYLPQPARRLGGY